MSLLLLLHTFRYELWTLLQSQDLSLTFKLTLKMTEIFSLILKAGSGQTISQLCLHSLFTSLTCLPSRLSSETCFACDCKAWAGAKEPASLLLSCDSAELQTLNRIRPQSSHALTAGLQKLRQGIKMQTLKHRKRWKTQIRSDQFQVLVLSEVWQWFRSNPQTLPVLAAVTCSITFNLITSYLHST